jgi:MYXO-CTERM domain-containing protein
MSLFRFFVASSLLAVAAHPAFAESTITNALAAPSVTTGAAAADLTSAVVSGSVTSENGSTVTARGFVYNTAGNPALESGTTVTVGSGSGYFSTTLSNLAVGTTYQIRAYATNAVGTAYGTEISLPTATPQVARDEVAATAVAVIPTVDNPSALVYSASVETLTGTAGASALLSITVDGGTAGTATASTAGVWSYALTSALAVGDHTIVIVADNTDGSTSKKTFVQSVFATTGYGASAYGGSYGTEVTATTAADFITYATSSSVYVINVSGHLSVGTVAITSSKTIQGVDGSASIDGCLSLNSVSNVIIRGLNLSNPSGHALQVINSTKLFVTHCTFLNCSTEQVDISFSDLITFAWCEFASTTSGQAAMKLGREGVNDTPRITLHHNWWSDNLASALPAAASGYVHQFSNYVNTPGNSAGTALSGAAQLLSEGNHFKNVANPLTKSGTATIRINNNVYTSCTGTTAEGADAVFTPGYSYEMHPTSQLATVIPLLAGNTDGARSDDPDIGSATITASATTVATGVSATLTAVPSGVTASTYQWRLANSPISGATSSTYTISSMSSSTAGMYTVAIGLADGSTVVSLPVTLTLDTTTSDDDDDDDDSGGGGDCGLLFPAVLVLFALRRRRA